MPSAETLETRVDHLEDEVRVLREKISSMKSQGDWRTTVGAFAEDSDFQEIVRAGAEQRQAERPSADESC